MLESDTSAEVSVPDAEQTMVSDADPLEALATAEPAPDERERESGSPRRFGAGPGGRVAALLLVAALVGLGILAVYLFVSR
jgi:hypothetical protein